MLHDTAEKVRIAFVELLISIKPVKSIKFYDICPIDHLLPRLALDPPLAVPLTNILINS